MKVHEHQAKKILDQHRIPVPRGRVAAAAKEAAQIAEELGGRVVVKAQVHAGGRGKAGGIKVASSPEEAGQAAQAMLGTRLVTLQTGPDGIPVNHVLVEEAVNGGNELYLGMLVDGAAKAVVVIASGVGGVEIEEVAAKTPERVLRVAVEPSLGLLPYQARRLAYGLDLKPELTRTFASLAGSLYEVFEGYDCSLAEINPLTVTDGDRLLAVDAKLSFDDDALFRHAEIQEMRDPEQEEALEARAREYDLSYVKLSGDVGCIVNGAGLAMATMDVIGAAGASPANFLDVGGGADEDKIAEAVRIVLSDSSVERVLVNVFGGILRCDVAAHGILIAAEAMPHAVRPMVVRMQGTNAEEGRRILSESSLNVTLADDLNEVAAAIKAAG